MRTTDTIAVNAKQFATQCLAMGKALGFDDEILRLAFVELCSGNKEQSTPVTTYPVTVDYGLSLSEMIKAGHYDYANSDITAKNFPKTEMSGKVKTNLELVHLNHSATTDEVLAHMEAQGFRPATLPELLAFGKMYPDVQREFPVVALGSSWVGLDGYCCVAFLWDGGGKRSLYLDWCEDGWYGFCRFLAARK